MAISSIESRIPKQGIVRLTQAMDVEAR
jgi:hypothetical protein